MIRWLPALLLAAVVPAQAQPAGEPLAVVFEADVEPADGTARVSLAYRLHVDAGVDRIPLLGLHFLGARIKSLEASMDGIELDPESAREGPESTGRVADPDLAPAAPIVGDWVRSGGAGGNDSPLYSGHLPLPEPVRSDGERELILTYEVAGALRADGDAFDLVVPVLIVDWRPTTAPPDMFRARVSLPEAFNIAAAFPTVRRTVEAGDGTRVESFRLQVTPSVVRFRGTVGDQSFLTLGLLVDLVVGLFLLGLVAYGTVRWRRSLDGVDG